MLLPDNYKTFEDAFELLCGNKIGTGCYRDVYECRLDRSLVVKVEIRETWRTFTNVLEFKFWDYNRDYKGVSQWLAPCELLSPDGRVLLQKRVDILKETDPNIPERIPAFLTDRKYSNFGWYEGRLVCCDYASTIVSPSTRLGKADFWS